MVRNVATPPSASVRGFVPRSGEPEAAREEAGAAASGWLWLAAVIVARKYQRSRRTQGWLNPS